MERDGIRLERDRPVLGRRSTPDALYQQLCQVCHGEAIVRGPRRDIYPLPMLPWVECVSQEDFIPPRWHHGSNSYLGEWHLVHLMRLANTTNPILVFNDNFMVTVGN